MSVVSIIVPVYKAEKYLTLCVESILAQTFTDFELILVDDGSPDNCPSMCDEYAKRDARIHVIHQKNGGLSIARNAGLDWCFANSSNEWFSFIDSDDWVHPSMLEWMLSAIQETKTFVCVCGYEEYFYPENVYPCCKCSFIKTTPEAFLMEHTSNAVVAWGKIYRREIFRNLRFPVGKLHEDEFVCHRTLFRYNEISVIPESLYFYFTNPKGITKSRWTFRHLDAIEAKKMRLIAFMKEKRSQKLIRFQIRDYLYCFYNNIQHMTDSENKTKQEYRRKLIQEVLIYGYMADLSAAYDNSLLFFCFPEYTAYIILFLWRIYRKFEKDGLQGIYRKIFAFNEKKNANKN